MNAASDKTQEERSQSTSNESSQKINIAESTFQFVDRRPEAVAQRKLQDIANNSTQTNRAVQLQAITDNYTKQQLHPIQKKESKTGLPSKLKTGVEHLSGYSLDDVKVHYNSSKPAQLQAHAYAQGTEIHLASGQEKHLPHEAWHVVQQKQGRVKPTVQLKGKVHINDDAHLEKEADRMGAKASKIQTSQKAIHQVIPTQLKNTVQRVRDVNDVETTINDVGHGQGVAEGFGAMVGAKKWVTKVGWGGLDASGEGTSMEARPLGPDHPSGADSGYSDDQSSARAQFLTAITGTPYIQGHLLNDNLGGPAERRNLTAIPGKPGNSAHSTGVEEPIKAEIDLKRWVHYTVQVAYVAKTIKQISPQLTPQKFNNIKGTKAYKNLPGAKPVNLNSNFRLASSFSTEWYTYQANGQRHSAVKRLVIKFPIYLNNSAGGYTDDDGYVDEFVEVGGTSAQERKINGVAARATNASWLGMDKNLGDKKGSVAPNVEPDDYEKEALRIWEFEYENCVDEDAETLTYPEIIAAAMVKKEVSISGYGRRIRQSRREEYIKKYDDNEMHDEHIGTQWKRYKTYLKLQLKSRYENEWRAVRDSPDQTLT